MSQSDLLASASSTRNSGPEIGNWQRFLRDLGYTDSNGEPLIDDEDFGPKTEWATKNFQIAEFLHPTGKFDEATRFEALSQGFVPFIQAKNFTKLWPRRRSAPRIIVIHTMEAPEKPGTARAVAEWFASDRSPVASAHFCVDDQETIQCVRESDVAYAAPGANQIGLHLEHAGYASQSAIDWSDDYSQAVLERSAQLAALLAKRYVIPIIRLGPEDLRSPGVGGFCGHIDVTNGLNGGKGHVDPGLNYPWDSYLARVKEIMST